LHHRVPPHLTNLYVNSAALKQKGYFALYNTVHILSTYLCLSSLRHFSYSTEHFDRTYRHSGHEYMLALLLCVGGTVLEKTLQSSVWNVLDVNSELKQTSCINS